MNEIQKLKRAYEDVIWMAIRYANGRQTYAPYMVRDSIRAFQSVFPDWKPRHDRTIKEDKEMLLNWRKSNGPEALHLDGDWLDDLFEDGGIAEKPNKSLDQSK